MSLPAVGALTLSGVESGKRAAAYAAVDAHCRSNSTIGIGSGSTIVYAVDALIERVKQGKLQNLRCIPTSFQSIQLITASQGALQLSSLTERPSIDVAFDGADEVDELGNCIKGGGACQMQEKIVAANAATFIIIADSRKNSAQLGTTWRQGIPIEVLPLAYAPVLRTLSALQHDSLTFKPTLRMCTQGKAGPIVTDNGCFVIDLATSAPLQPQQVDAINIKLSLIPGIVETGLFPHTMVTECFFGDEQGQVKRRSAGKQQTTAAAAAAVQSTQ